MKRFRTVYNSIVFDSQAEAQVACFFDCAGIRYEYAPVIFRSRIPKGADTEEEVSFKPDFYLPQYDVYAEVKGSDEFLFGESVNKKIGVSLLNTELGEKGLLIMRGVPFERRYVMTDRSNPMIPCFSFLKRQYGLIELHRAYFHDTEWGGITLDVEQHALQHSVDSNIPTQTTVEPHWVGYRKGINPITQKAFRSTINTKFLNQEEY